MDAILDVVRTVLPYLGWLVALAFLFLGLFLIYAMFVADRPKKEKGTKQESRSWFARDGEKTNQKGRLVAKGKQVSKDEAVQSVYARPAATGNPGGFSFGGSAPLTPGEGFTLPQAVPEPRPSQELPSIPPVPPRVRPNVPSLPPRIRKPGQ